MTLPVFLAPVGAVASGAVVVVEGEEARHAVVVRRVRVGERVVLTDGEGTSATCTVAATTRTSLEAVVDDVRRAERPRPLVTVVQAIPKGERGELAVELLTEVGVDRIVPWTAARCVAVWRGERATRSLARWRSTAREAAKQSRRSWHPEVTGPVGTDGVVALLEDADVAVVLHEEATTSLGALDVSGGSVVVVVGPEGGITEEELAAFGSAHVVRMGESVLRTSSAGLAAVAALLSRTDRWGQRRPR